MRINFGFLNLIGIYSDGVLGDVEDQRNLFQILSSSVLLFEIYVRFNHCDISNLFHGLEIFFHLLGNPNKFQVLWGEVVKSFSVLGIN